MFTGTIVRFWGILNENQPCAGKHLTTASLAAGFRDVLTLSLFNRIISDPLRINKKLRFQGNEWNRELCRTPDDTAVEHEGSKIPT